jgi:hypothetical protein
VRLGAAVIVVRIAGWRCRSRRSHIQLVRGGNRLTKELEVLRRPLGETRAKKPAARAGGLLRRPRRLGRCGLFGASLRRLSWRQIGFYLNARRRCIAWRSALTLAPCRRSRRRRRSAAHRLTVLLIDRARRYRSGPRFGTGFAHRFGFDFADRIFQRQALPRDLGLGQRRVEAAQLRHERRAGALVERAPGFSGIVAEPFYGACDQWMIICHSGSLRSAR